jgi:hypothetical protein
MCFSQSDYDVYEKSLKQKITRQLVKH